MDYTNLWGYLRDLYQTRGFGETTNRFHIEHHYQVCLPMSLCYQATATNKAWAFLYLRVWLETFLSPPAGEPPSNQPSWNSSHWTRYWFQCSSWQRHKILLKDLHELTVVTIWALHLILLHVVYWMKVIVYSPKAGEPGFKTRILWL